MQSNTGTVDVTNGSAVVTGTGTTWVTDGVAAGHGFTIASSGVVYDIASVDSETQVTLSSTYAGTTDTALQYTIFKDFTSPDNFLEMNKGDIETATIFTRNFRKLQGILTGDVLIDAVTGTVKMTWQGTWNSGTTYITNDVIEYNGSAYISLQDSNLNQNPVTATTYWELVVSKGDTGLTGVKFSWSTDTAASDPGAGYVKADNADLSLATIIRIDDVDFYSSDIQAWLRLFDDSTNTVKGYIKISDYTDDGASYVIYQIDSLTEQTGYFDVAVTHISGSVTTLTNNAEISIDFSRTGDVGADGANGTNGVDGVNASAVQEYTWSTDITASDPGNGLTKVNNADLSLATVLYIDDLDANLVDLQSFWNIIDDSTSVVKGYITLQEAADSSKFVIYQIDSLTDQAGYFEVTVTYIDGSITSITNSTAVTLGFVRNGDKGDTGATGATGAQGEFAGVAVNQSWHTDTTATDPGSGYIKANNADLSLATVLYADDNDVNATDIQAFLREFDNSTNTSKGYLRLSKELDATSFVIYEITALTEQTGYFDITVAYVSGSVTSFTLDDSLVVSFARTGDKGADGAGSGDMLASVYDPTSVAADAFDSANHAYNNTTSGLTATNVQAAIDELDGTLDGAAFYADVTANFTGTLQNGGSNVVVDTDIGSTVQAYSATAANYGDATANFTGTLQNGGSNVVVDSDIGSTVQAYDVDIPTVSASQAEMEAGTETALRSMSPLRVAQAIAALGGSGGGQVALIDTWTPTAVSSKSFTWDESIYADVIVFIEGVQPSSDNVNLAAAFAHTNGTVTLGSSHTTTYMSTGSTTLTSQTGAQGVRVGYPVGNAAGEGISATLIISGMNTTLTAPSMHVQSSFTDPSTAHQSIEGVGTYTASDGRTNVIDGVVLIWATGTFIASTGTVYVYGVKRA